YALELYSFPTRRSSDLHSSSLPTSIRRSDALPRAFQAVPTGSARRRETRWPIAKEPMEPFHPSSQLPIPMRGSDRHRTRMLPPRSEEHTSELQSRENLV